MKGTTKAVAWTTDESVQPHPRDKLATKVPCWTILSTYLLLTGVKMLTVAPGRIGLGPVRHPINGSGLTTGLTALDGTTSKLKEVPHRSSWGADYRIWTRAQRRPLHLGTFDYIRGSVREVEDVSAFIGLERGLLRSPAITLGSCSCLWLRLPAVDPIL